MPSREEEDRKEGGEKLSDSVQQYPAEKLTVVQLVRKCGLRDPSVHYHTHRSSLAIPVMNGFNLVYTSERYEVDFNVMLLSGPVSTSK